MDIRIAIDGPAGAGKSTLAKIIAQKLELKYIDTGAMYRALAWYAIKRGINVQDETAVAEILPDFNFTIKIHDEEQLYFVDDDDVTLAIRQDNIPKAASDISALQVARNYMTKLQRELAGQSGCVLDGRDIGTNVLPNAELKIYLTADVDLRAKRRYLQQKEKGIEQNLADIISEIKYRDLQDSTRKITPLRQAEDAIRIDNTKMTIDEVVDHVLNLVSQIKS